MNEMIDRNDLDNEAAELEALALRLSWGLRHRLQQQLEVFSLTLPQYMTMNILHRGSSGCSMSELAEASNQLSPTMTGIVDRLVERGLVTRERDDRDRRALRVELTDEGRHLMARISKQKRAWTRGFLQALLPEERVTINAVLLRFLEVVEALPAPVDEIKAGE